MRFKKIGFTIIECIIALLLLSIIMVGGMAFYTYASQYTIGAVHKKTALEMVNTKMEEIKNNGYASLPDPATLPLSGLWQGPTDISIAKLTGQENIYIYGIDENADSVIDYKKISIEVKWRQAGKANQQAITLDTYITP